MDIVGQKVSFSTKKAVMVVCNDVTLQEKQLEFLKESEERFKAAANIAKLGY